MTQRCTGSSLGPHVTFVLYTAKINNVERLLRVNRIGKILNTTFGGEMEKYVFFELLDKGKVLSTLEELSFPCLSSAICHQFSVDLCLRRFRLLLFFITPC